MPFGGYNATRGLLGGVGATWLGNGRVFNSVEGHANASGTSHQVGLAVGGAHDLGRGLFAHVEWNAGVHDSDVPAGALRLNLATTRVLCRCTPMGPLKDDAGSARGSKAAATRAAPPNLVWLRTCPCAPSRPTSAQHGVTVNCRCGMRTTLQRRQERRDHTPIRPRSEAHHRGCRTGAISAAAHARSTGYTGQCRLDQGARSIPLASDRFFALPS